MVSVQIFLTVLHKYQMRFHFSHIEKDGWYKPYKKPRAECSRRHDMSEVILGFKSLHFDWWGSPLGWPANSVGVYFPVRGLFGDIHYDHKHLNLPDLLRVLHSKQFDKKMAKQRLTMNEGLGALFG